MFAVNQDRMEKSIGHMRQHLGIGFLAQLSFIGHWLGLYSAIDRIRDERRRTVLIDELSRLDDYYLRDVGIDRSEIEGIADAMVKRVRKSRAS